MNKKGFTLVELLAVVVLMLAITVMAISGINASIERSKEKQDDAKKKVIVRYAELYYDEMKAIFIKNNKTCITVDELRSANVISDDEAKDSKGSYFCGRVCLDNETKVFKFIGC